MAKILFKGIQQVKYETFSNLTADEKKGYLWFVRKPMADDEGAENPLGNDRYSIFFGTRQYASFLEGETKVLADSLSAIKEALGLGDDFSFSFEGKTTVLEAFNEVKRWYDAVDGKIETALADFLIQDVDANDKVLSVADGILSSAIS
jgi:hypothetical protein